MATIFEALKVCEYLESVLKDSFGPCGLDVMLNSSSGNILITNNGGVVLDSLYIGHPLGRVIVNKMKSLSLVTGNGVTSYVIVLTQILREITKHLEIKAKQVLKAKSLQSIFFLSKAFFDIANNVAPDNMLAMLDKEAVHTDLNNKVEVKKMLIQLIRTTLKGNFSLHYQDLFASLMVDLVTNSAPQHGNEIYQVILQILDDFPQICVEFQGSPVQNSCVIQGFAIQRKFATGNKEVLLKSGKDSFAFLILQCSLDDIKLTAATTLNIKDEKMLDKALSYKRSVVLSVLQSLKEQDIELIISSEGASDMVLHLCRQFEIAVIQMVPMETVSHLCKYAKVQPLCHHNFFEIKYLSNVFIGKAVICKETTLGVLKFIQLIVKQDIDTRIVPHQILLFAPTQGLCQQYYIALQSILKNIKLSFSDDRQQLVTVPGCGSVEFLLSIEFANFAKTVQDINMCQACLILSTSLLQIPRTLHKNSHSCASRDRNFIRVQHEVESSWRNNRTVLGVDGMMGSVIDPYNKGIYEPLKGKMFWLSHLLQCLSMILRVERVIAVNCIVSKDEKKSCDTEDEEL